MHNRNVILQMPSAQKLPFAHITFKLSLPSVNLHVFPQVLCRKEAFAANGTQVRPFRTVDQQMASQVCHTSIPLATAITRIWTLPGVKAIYVHLEMAQQLEPLLTLFTLEEPFSSVHHRMAFKVTRKPEAFATYIAGDLIRSVTKQSSVFL
jgi:hypothetical protein